MKNILCTFTSVIVAVFSLTATAATFDAATYYVNCQLDDYTGHDGKTPEKAYETIQEAANAAVDNSTIVVYPGEYNKGNGRGSNTTHWWGQSRIHLGSKNVYIKSLKGAAETHIVGKLGDNGGLGGGQNDFDSAMRCIDIEVSAVDGNNDLGTKEVVIEGFTLRNGATRKLFDGTRGAGAALFCGNGGAGHARNCAIVDCVISNCYGGYSLVYGGSIVRTRVTKNTFYKLASAQVGAPFIDCNVINSLCDNNIVIDYTGTEPDTSKFLTDSMPIGGGVRLVNTTFMNNRSGMWCSTGTKWYNCVNSMCSFNSNDGGQPYTDANVVVDDSSVRNLMAPAIGDYRVRAGTTAATIGDPTKLADTTLFPLASGIDRFLDIDHQVIAESGTICAGASQTVVTPTTGCIRGNGSNVVFDGSPFAHWKQGWVYADELKSIALTPAKSDQTFKFFSWDALAGSTVKSYQLPNLKGITHLLLPPTTETVQTINAVYVGSGHTFYCNPNLDDYTDHDGTTPELAFETIQEAVDAIPDANHSIIFLAPGTYKKGNGLRDGMKVRVHYDTKNILVKGEDPTTTFIVGDPDPDTGDVGPGATLAVAMGSTAQLQGVTITGAYGGTGVWTGTTGKGPIYSYGQDLMIADCIISNNHSYTYAVGTATFMRCRIFDNWGPMGLAIDPMMISCVIGNNHLGGEVFDVWNAYPKCLYNCTILGDSSVTTFATHSTMQEGYVNLALANGCGTADFQKSNLQFIGGVLSGFTAYPSGYTAQDPMFCDTTANDYRLFSKSAGVTAGVIPGADTTAPYWWTICTMDVDGNPWQLTDGKPISGAIQEIATGGMFVARGQGGLSITGGDFGFNDEPVTLGMTAGASRPLVGISTNGVTLLFDAEHPTYTFEPGSGDAAIEPVYATDNTWYVDATHGSLGNYGYNRAYPAKRLSQVLGMDALLSGDTVLALPGIYNEGEMIQEGSYVLKARAVVKAGVTLKGESGWNETFIQGQAASTSDIPPGEMYQDLMEGLGPTAIRGVYLDAGATLEGFTVENGYTRGSTDAGEQRHGGADYVGAGAYLGSGAVVRQCQFRNNKSFRGGGSYGGVIDSCYYTNNVALYCGGATSGGKIYNSLSVGNVSYNNNQACGFFYWDALEGCTALDGVGSCGWFSSSDAGGVPVAVMKNCLVLGYVAAYDRKPGETNFINCAFNKAKVAPNQDVPALLAAHPTCIYTNLTELTVDADGRPVPGYNLAIDAADETVTAYVKSTDLYNGPRVTNGQRDIGALEADWLPRYTQDLGKTGRLAVTNASPMVVETADQAVRLTDGTGLVATISAVSTRSHGYVVRYAMQGEGRLTLRLNGGEAVELPASGHEYTFSSELLMNELAFAYEGTGSADLSRIGGSDGMVIIVQ